MTEPAQNSLGVRLDQWLHAARFYKTRALASSAVKNGRVRVNGDRVKPAKTISVGDELVIQRDDQSVALTVTALARRRVSAKIAATYYQESAESIAAREDAAVRRRFEKFHAPSPGRRPDKKSRRRLIQLGRGDP